MNKQYARISVNLLAAAALSVFLAACGKPAEVVIPDVEDSVLTANVKAALAADPELKGLPLTVDAKAGVVKVGGTIDTYPQIDRALSIVRGVTGVKSVDDQTVKNPTPAAPPAGAAPAAAPAAPAAAPAAK